MKGIETPTRTENKSKCPKGEKSPLLIPHNQFNITVAEHCSKLGLHP